MSSRPLPISIAIVVAALLARGAPAFAQPDLSGLWTNASLTALERPKDFTGLVASAPDAARYEREHRNTPPVSPDPDDKVVGGPESEWWERDTGLARIRGEARTSWIIEPADGQLPLRPEAREAAGAAFARFKTDYSGPEARPLDERCLSAGAKAPLINGGQNDNFQLVQTPTNLVIHAEWMQGLRVVRLGDTRHPPPNVRVAGGDSIGRWEGRVLVVESTNFTAGEVKAPDSDPAADMTVTERFSLISPTELLYVFTVSNPSRYSQAWTAEMILRRTEGPIYEYACHEGNYALTNILAGARRLESDARAEVSAPADARAAPVASGGQR